MAVGKSKCEKCGIEFKWRTSKDRSPPKLCSAKCKFRWEKATEEERIERIKTNLEKFTIKLQGCWDWKGIIDRDGYAKLSISKSSKINRASHASWIVYKGKITEGKIICHSCDNRKCVNPEHLFLGTYKENTQDMISKGRMKNGIWNQLGSKNPRSKMNEEQVKEVKKMIQQGKKNREISEKFGVSYNSISDIKLNKCWKHVRIDT